MLPNQQQEPVPTIEIPAVETGIRDEEMSLNRLHHANSILFLVVRSPGGWHRGGPTDEAKWDPFVPPAVRSTAIRANG